MPPTPRETPTPESAVPFEGPEKKVVLSVDAGQGSLRAFGEHYWREIVRAAGADILSMARATQVDAYLLSESSLFVYDDSLTLITCGRTHLLKAIELFVRRAGRGRVTSLRYERRDEHFPSVQPSSFAHDARRLQALVGGAVLHLDERSRVSLFHTSTGVDPSCGRPTLEILMRGIDPAVATQFERARGPAFTSHLGLTSTLEAYLVDEYFFEPVGYSFNALLGGAYQTLHVTPESAGSYASFETNRPVTDWASVVSEVVSAFRPQTAELLTFGAEATRALSPSGYWTVQQTEVLGYDVRLIQVRRGERPASPSRSSSA